MQYSKSKLDPVFLNTPLAHRGLHGVVARAVENSPLAFAQAMDHGYGIECDLQSSRDGKAVVFHDDELGRLTNEKGATRARDLAELQNIRLKNSPDTIPSFAEFLDQVDGRVPILVELKDQSGMLIDEHPKFINDIIELCRAYSGHIALMSFNPYYVLQLRQALPEFWLGCVTDNFSSWSWRQLPKTHARALNGFQLCPKLEIDFVSHNWRDLARIRDWPGAKLCWTVKSDRQEVKARKIADNITFENYLATS